MEKEVCKLPVWNTDDYLEMYGTNMRPQDVRNGYPIRPGLYLENGATVLPGGVSFTIHSEKATAIELLLFPRGEEEPCAAIPFPEEYKVGDVYSMFVFGLDIEEYEYAYRAFGPYDLEKGYLFDPSRHIIDPYGRAVVGQSRWAEKTTAHKEYRSRIVSTDFDWGSGRPASIDLSDLIIYELHIRGFTNHPSSGVEKRGTYAGLIEKIPYLKQLGINAVELMPIFEFDELLGAREHEGKLLIDYWGYNPISFFAPNTSYSSEIEYNREGTELKSLIKALHDNDIKVILDVVFNHTGEGDENGPVICFKGLDNHVYYMLTPDARYYNFSGCGNTLNANHPVVQQMIIDCLRYWVAEFHIDGFRFDLASILGRNEDGKPMPSPPLLKNLEYDPLLAGVYLIAEAWDAGGLYQVGSFPSWRRWSEWNGLYRDDLRRYLRGDPNMALTVARRIIGSPDLYNPEDRGPNSSINFITCHDGFTLYDLFSYNVKHNEANGWNNTDGENYNHSWNCGIEGETDHVEILNLRRRMSKNAIALLLASRGTPMLLAGDEFANTQYGNNNPYCQDNEISWLDWGMLEQNQELFNFFRYMIRLRKESPVIRGKTEVCLSGLPDTSFHGTEPWMLTDDPENRMLGVMMAGCDPETNQDDIVYIGANMHWEPVNIQLPKLQTGSTWRVMVDTAQEAGEDWGANASQVNLSSDNRLLIDERSVVILRAFKH
jgi:glycogen operon protein